MFKSSSHVTQSINISILMVPKMERRLGVLLLSGNHCNSFRIPDGSSVFTTEAKAIDLALDFITAVSFLINFQYFQILFRF